MRPFSELLKYYTERSGISDAELARAVGVRRQTIFRWKEGSVARPRSREDVLAVSQKLRLSPTESDELLVAAGFHPEGSGARVEQPVVAAAGVEEESGDPPLRAQLPASFVFPERAEETEATHASGFSRARQIGVGVALILLLALVAASWWARRTPLPVAAPGETLVIVGQFVNFTAGEIGFNVAGRIADLLRQEIEGAGLTGVRVALWPEPIRSEAEAQATLTRSAAWMVIWGEYDSGRVLARFTQSEIATPPPAVESLIASPDALFATINSEVPKEVRYLALLTLGAFYADSNNYPQARAILLRAYSSPPQERDARATLLFRLGLVHQLGDDPQPATAIDFYSELLVLSPDHLLAWYNRGLARLSQNTQKDWEQAIADFDQAIQRSPGFLAARVGRGVAYLYRQGPSDEDGALADFSYVIERDDQRVMAYYNRGLLAIRRDERRLWEGDLQRTIELAPEFASGHSALCWGYVLDGEAAAALPACDQAIALGSQEALHSRGMAYAQLGDFAQASRDLRAFLAWVEQQPATSPYRSFQTQVNGWLATLTEGKNPLTPEILDSLRRE